MTVTQLPDHAQRRRSHADALDPRRTIRLDRVETREVSDAGGVVFEGHAAMFDQTSELLYDRWGFPFREVIRAGAFADVIAANADGREDTKFLGLNHDRNHPLARCGNDTLTLEEDDEGLLTRATLPNTQAARDLVELLSGGVVHQMSFTFTATADGARWTWDYETGEDLREVTACARLFDVSPVVYPAYTGTDAALRGLAELRSLAHRGNDLPPQRLTTLGQMVALVDGLPDDVRTAARARVQPPAEKPASTRDEQAARDRRALLAKRTLGERAPRT